MSRSWYLVFLFCALSQLRFTLQSRNEIVACRLASSGCVHSTNSLETCEKSQQRIIAIGDIHGSYESLLKILYFAKITSDPYVCEWSDKVIPTLLIQMGDLTDRGIHSLESFKCLASLQLSANKVNSKVIRLVGNHDLWWLEGLFHATEE